MANSLNEQYDDVLALLVACYEFRNSIMRRLYNPVKKWKIPRRCWFQWWQELKLQNLLTCKHPAQSEMLSFLATDDERKNPLFPLITAAYPIEALSKDLEGRFPDYDFQKIYELHKQRVEERSRIGAIPGVIVGMVLGFGTLLLKSTPKSAVVRLGWDYDGFEFFVFWFTVFVAGYMGLVLLPLLWFAKRGSGTVAFVSLVLGYTALRLKKDAK